MAGRQSTFQAIIATLVITRRAGPRFGHGRFRTVAAGQAIITTLVISRRARTDFGQGRSGAARRWRAIITALVIARRTRSVFLHRHLGENGLCCQHPDCPKHDTATNKKHKKKLLGGPSCKALWQHRSILQLPWGNRSMQTPKRGISCSAG